MNRFLDLIKNNKKRTIGISMILFLCLFFIIVYSSLADFMKTYDAGIRNTKYNKGTLTEAKTLVIEKEIENIDITFENKKKNIYVKLTSNNDTNIFISGYTDEILRESSNMEKKSDYYQFTFNYDYININKVNIRSNTSFYVDKIEVFYLS